MISGVTCVGEGGEEFEENSKPVVSPVSCRSFIYEHKPALHVGFSLGNCEPTSEIFQNPVVDRTATCSSAFATPTERSNE